MQILAIGDLHLGHKNITKFRTEFSSVKEHDDCILDNLSIISKRNLVWFLGDVAFDKTSLNLLSKLPFRKRLILGNHDLSKDITMQDLIQVYEQIDSLVSYKNTWISHCPIHPDEIRNRCINIHGHTHSHIINDCRYVNLSAENIKYTPVDLIHLISEIKNFLRF